MRSTRSRAFGRFKQDPRPLAVSLALLALGTACASGPAELPPPRPLVVHSGVRLNADPERLQVIYDWLMPEVDSIDVDPSFLIESIPGDEDTYPWETLIIQGDTARFQYPRGYPDVQTSYMIYAHLHLMDHMDRLDVWLPEADSLDLEGYELERAIVSQMLDSWLLGRAIFDTQPYLPMDELLYAKEHGYLDGFLFTLREDDFPEARAAWLAANPQGLEAYQAWFQSTFNEDPPGVRPRR